MIVFVIMLFILALYKSKPLLKRGFYEDYSSVEQTRSINGIFIILILLSHTFAKVPMMGVLDEVYLPFRTFLGQFVVVPFLFYSGYGIMESLSKKDSYLKNFPKKRLLNLFIKFAIITIIYILLHLCLQNTHSVSHVLLSFVGITSLGHGGWYILSTFFFYLSVIVCFNCFKKNKILATIAVTLCLIALMAIEIALDFPTYYYSTFIFFAIGMFYSLFKKTFDNIVMKNNFVWWIVLLVSIFGFASLKEVVNKLALFYPVWCGFGMLMILCITMKIKIQNKALMWCGKNIFYLFTLQGIPQIVFTKYLSNNYVIYILVIVSSILLVLLADILFKKGEQLLQERNKKHEN